MKDNDYFLRIAGDNLFRQWLEKEKAQAITVLAAAEGATLHRAQGRFRLIEDILNRLEDAKGLRG